MVERLTPPAFQALQSASERARAAAEIELLSRHLLAVLTERPDSTSSRLLREAGVVTAPLNRFYQVDMAVLEEPAVDREGEDGAGLLNGPARIRTWDQRIMSPLL